jgi:hypothetical protein
MYVEGNPVNYVDPTGYAKNALGRLKEIIDQANSNGAEALFKAFEDHELYYVWGSQAGTTLSKRLSWLLHVSSGTSRIPDWIPEPVGSVLAEVLGFQFGLPFGSDCGFAEEFQDSGLYPSWGLEPSESNQVAHFLSAVSLTYKYIINAEIHKQLPLIIRNQDIILMGDLALAAIIGHEKTSDDPTINGLLNQLNSVYSGDIDLWYQAVTYDETGQYLERDHALWSILEFKQTTPFEGVEGDRLGNSLQDLRLSLKGYRFAKYVWKNPNLPPLYGGYWLRANLSINRHNISPFGP